MTCRTCLKPGHLASNCRTCTFCGVWGHTEDNCRQNSNASKAYCKYCKEDLGDNGHRHWSHDCEILKKKKQKAKKYAQYERWLETYKHCTNEKGENEALLDLCIQNEGFADWLDKNEVVLRLVDQPLEETEHVDCDEQPECAGEWECEHCGEQFLTRKEAEDHEESECLSSPDVQAFILRPWVFLRRLCQSKTKTNKQETDLQTAIKHLITPAFQRFRLIGSRAVLLREKQQDDYVQRLIKAAFKTPQQKVKSADLRKEMLGQPQEPKRRFAVATKPSTQLSKQVKKAKKKNKIVEQDYSEFDQR